MGNRAAVLFGDGKAKDIGVCLQWNGGPESIYAFAKLLASYKASQGGAKFSLAVDSASMSTRFVQLVTNYFSQVSSDFLSIHLVPDPGRPGEKHLPTEHGIYRIKPDFAVERFDYEGRTWSDSERLAEFADVLRHPYWADEDSLSKDLRQANDKAFLRRYVEVGPPAYHGFTTATLPIERELVAARQASKMAAIR